MDRIDVVNPYLWWPRTMLTCCNAHGFGAGLYMGAERTGIAKSTPPTEFALMIALHSSTFSLSLARVLN